MASTQVRISRSAYDALREMAEQDQASLIETLDLLVEREHRRRFLEANNTAYARLDGETFHHEEIAPWDGTPSDGLMEA